MKKTFKKWQMTVMTVLTALSSPFLFASVAHAGFTQSCSLSTTGAAANCIFNNSSDGIGRMTYRDTLSDGHCAFVQWRVNSSSSWTSSPHNCTSTNVSYNIVPFAPNTVQVRVCRSGVGNCSGIVTRVIF